MSTIKAYGVINATQPLGPLQISRRDPRGERCGDRYRLLRRLSFGYPPSP